MMTLRVDCYISLGCASEETLRENMERALELEAVEAEVGFHRISDAEANNLALRGSPSVLMNGVDILPGEIPGFS